MVLWFPSVSTQHGQMIQVPCKDPGQGRRQRDPRAQALGAPLRAVTFLLHSYQPFHTPILPASVMTWSPFSFSTPGISCWYAILTGLLSSHHPGPITVGLDTAVTSRSAPTLFRPSVLWSIERLTFKLCFYSTAIFKATTGPVSAGPHFLLMFKAKHNLASFLNPLISCFTKGHFCLI